MWLSQPVVLVVVTALALTPSMLAAENLVVNGDFESGNAGFTTDYVYSPGDINAADYDIVTDPSESHPAAASYADHTCGGGLMMTVNGATTSNQVVWSETVDVAENEGYVISIWVSSWRSSNPAQLRVLINSIPIAPDFQAPSETGVWVNFSASWDSMNETTAVIEIIDQNLASGGNDFALDDISFGRPHLCPSDIDGDGEVGIVDFLKLLSDWGPCL